MRAMAAGSKCSEKGSQALLYDKYLNFCALLAGSGFASPMRQADGLRQENRKARGVEGVRAPRWSCDVAVLMRMGAMIGARRQGLVHHVVFV